MQVITYKEFLPALLGEELPPYAGYSSQVHPGLSNAFAAAAYRIGHSMVGDDIDLLDENFQATGIVELADVFFNPEAMTAAGGVDPVIRYFASNIQQETDTMIVDPLRNFLFGPPGAGGLDLASLNIQRGRDHGLGDYNTMRADFGLSPVTSFAQITSDPAMAQRLSDVYGSVQDIDPWVGMLAEDHLPGASIGATHAAIFREQFGRLRDGDPFWYERNGFSAEELAALEATRLADIFQRNTGVSRLQRSVFFAATLPLCPADFNADGARDADDLSDFITCFFLDVQSPGVCASADFNGDTFRDADDLSDYITAFFQGC